MNVSEIMASVVQKVGPDEPLIRAASMMKDYDIGCLVVLDGAELLGIVTDRDIVVRGLADPLGIEGMTVAEVMTPDPAYCSMDDTINQAAGIMETHRVRRLPVLDFGRRLCGIVSLGDICTHAAQGVSAGLIEEVSRPTHSFLAESA